MDDDRQEIPGSRLGLRERKRRRQAARQARTRRRQLLAVPVALVVALIVVIAVASAEDETSKAPASRSTAPTSSKAPLSEYARAAAVVANKAPVGVVSGGHLAPVAFGGLAALWAPRNVVGAQPGTAAAYLAASRLEGMPGYLLIADRGNNRILVVNPQRRIVYEYPSAADRKAGRRLFYNDDTFVEPGGHALIANEEDNNDIVEVSLVNRSVHVIFGRPGKAGSDATHVHTPDDAYMLPGGTFTVADAYGCRIIFVRAHRIVRQYGTSGVCRHEPPRYLDAVNGDTPLPNGGTLLSEINGSWIDEISRSGKLVFATQVPVSYPSDPQPLPGGRMLLADYASPGHVLIVDRHGDVLWRYGPSSGHGMLDHPSLAMALPNGDVVVNDDFRDRVVEIDPRTNRIVWQYGHTDHAGTAPGYLHIPDGMDFVPAGPNGGPDYAAVVHP
jgi:outer membrane protein assembly factor BamB